MKAALAGLEDDLEVSLPARLLLDLDLVEDVVVVAGEEGAAADDDVDLVCAGGDRVSNVGRAYVERLLARRECPGDAGRLDRWAGGVQHGVEHHLGAHTYRRDRGDGATAEVGSDGLAAECGDLAGRVHAF